MKVLRNQQGAALITAMVILVLLTIIGLAATNTSMLETMISGTEKTRSEAFYAAEAGVEHLRRNFKDIFVAENNAKIASEDTPDWNFALQGSPEIPNSAATGTTYATGALWIEDGNLSGNYLYDVTVWNNQDDGGTAIDDTDGIIFLRADARVPGGGTASIEVMLKGETTGSEGLGGYGGQEGGGAGKNYSANDVNAVDHSFSQQISTKRN